ncbi:MAG TPA: ATP-binding protein [Thermoanaerobaculia bacterium]|nr:ATP-binding protein [Thermoanaerobaculia bacterium]
MALLLDRLQIKNFRAFRSLEIEQLGRVNLIVGANSSGKSTVLEALRIYASRGASNVLWELLLSREELPSSNSKPLALDRVTTAFMQLFNGRPWRWEGSEHFEIGSKDREAVLVDTGRVNASPVLFSGTPGMMHTVNLEHDSRFPFHLAIAPHAYVPPDGFTSSFASGIWDKIALSELEDFVVEILQIIAPTAERISFIGEPTESRIAVAKLREERRAIPVRSLGDGVNRILGIALALVSGKGGFVLIDEIENGIHFSVQRKLWDSIFKAAQKLDVQVFATTHSLECIEAFQEASAADQNEEAILIRLDRHDGNVESFVLSERELTIATRDGLEVR